MVYTVTCCTSHVVNLKVHVYTCCVRICFLHVQCGEMRQTISMQRLAKMRTHVPIVQWDQYYLGYLVTVTCWSLLDGICNVSNFPAIIYTYTYYIERGAYLEFFFVHIDECFNYTGPWDTLEQNDAMLSSGTPKKNIGEPSRASTNLQMSWNTWSLDAFDVHTCQQLAMDYVWCVCIMKISVWQAIVHHV